MPARRSALIYCRTSRCGLSHIDRKRKKHPSARAGKHRPRHAGRQGGIHGTGRPLAPLLGAAGRQISMEGGPRRRHVPCRRLRQPTACRRQSKCRILALADGKEVANFATGVPAGQGVANGSRYYLPLRTGAESKAPEICVVDVAKGAVAVRFPLANRQVPGNLVMGDGEIVSQTMTGIAGFPQLRIPPEQLGRPLAADQLGTAWANLGDAEGRPSVNAGWLLAAVPEQAVPFLKQQGKSNTDSRCEALGPADPRA